MTPAASRPGLLASPALFLGAVCLLAAGLRLYGFAAVDLWQDEANELFISQGGFSETLERIRRSEMRPPLRYYLLKLWLLGGSGTAWLRLPSLLFSLASVPLLYATARRLLREDAARLATLLLAAASFPVSSAQFCRSYSMDAFTALLAVYAFVRLSEVRSPARRAGYVASAALAAYTSYFFAPLLAVLAARHALAWWRGGLSTRAWVSIYAPLSLLLLPLAPLALEQLANARAHGWRAHGADLERLVRYLQKLSAGRIKNFGEPSVPQRVTAALCAGLAAWGGARLLRGSAPGAADAARLFVWWFALPTALLFGVSLFSLSVFTERTMIVYAPAWYALLAVGLLAVNPAPLRALLVAAVLVVNAGGFLASEDLRYRTQGVREAAARLDDLLEPGEWIVHASHFTYFPMRFYAPALPHRILQERVEWNWGAAQVPDADLLADLAPVRRQPGFWLVHPRRRHDRPPVWWQRQLAQIAAAWPEGEDRHGLFHAGRSLAAGRLVLTHFRRARAAGALPDAGPRQRELWELLRSDPAAAQGADTRR